MDIVTLDFETYWDVDYSLNKLSPLEYVLGDKWQTISCAIKVNEGPTVVYFGDRDVAAALAAIDWGNSAAMAHNNSGFDAYILAYRYNIKPKLWMCTLAMARPIHAKGVGLSLGRLLAFYKLGTKNPGVLMQTRGRRLEQFTAQEIADMRVYNAGDTEGCYALYKILAPLTGSREMWQIDMTVRMRTEPAFVLDQDMLQKALLVEKEAKRVGLMSLARMLGKPLIEPEEGAMIFGGLSNVEEIQEEVRAEMASAPKFSALLIACGVEVPMKPSPTAPDSGKLVPALAKSDPGFLALLAHENEVVATAARTRLQIKSTLLETRIAKLCTAAKLAKSKLPVPIRYYGADTTGRDSGEEYNMLNFPRINKKKPARTDVLRNSLRAPPGKLVIVADQSNIELRVNHTLWKVPSSIAMWKTDPKADLYRAGAAIAYGCKSEEVTESQRQAEKIKQLGLGFGAGPDTFCTVAKNMGGLDLGWITRPATDEEITNRVTERLRGHIVEPFVQGPDGKHHVRVSYPAAEAVKDWRERHRQIVGGWHRCHEALPYIGAGNHMYIDPWHMCSTSSEGIALPDGRVIRYPNLRQMIMDPKTGKAEWVYADGRHLARIYAGKVTENIVQALARTTICDATIEFFTRTGLRPALRPYDELVYIVDEKHAEALLAELQSVLRTPPTWWPELVVWSEGGIGETYGAAK
jgi:hypothetical protein